MKKLFSPLISKAIIASAILLPTAVFAQNVNEITIVNHFDKALNFVVGINPSSLPDLPEHFTLSPNNQIKTRVLDNNKEAYVRAEDDSNDSAFWAIEVKAGKPEFHGYISKGIAYSWNTQTIVFCTPEEYKKHNSCLG